MVYNSRGRKRLKGTGMGDSMLFSKPGAIDSAHMGRTYGSQHTGDYAFVNGLKSVATILVDATRLSETNHLTSVTATTASACDPTDDF